jgi:carboxymethylenebutenolidase
MWEDFKEPKTKQDKMDSLLHLYIDGAFGRRELLKRLTKVSGSAAVATAFFEQSGWAQATPSACPDNIRVPEDAPDIVAEDIQYPGQAGNLFGHLAKPKNLTEALPAIITIHENRGLVPHHRDMTRRFARAGYVALGVDLLSRQGGTRAFPEDQLTAAYGRTTPAGRLEDLLSTIDYLKSEGFVRPDRIGVTGFCAGGANSYMLAFASRDIAAAAPFYGAPMLPIPDMNNVCPMCVFMGDVDPGTNANIPALITAINSARKSSEIHMWAGARHAFMNDTGAAFNATAACASWDIVLAFFKRELFRT